MNVQIRPLQNPGAEWSVRRKRWGDVVTGLQVPHSTGPRPHSADEVMAVRQERYHRRKSGGGESGGIQLLPQGDCLGCPVLIQKFCPPSAILVTHQDPARTPPQSPAHSASSGPALHR